MTVHHLAGIRPAPLASYLAGLGLIRLLGEQADPALTAWWDEGGLAVDTTVEDAAGWLAERYVPTPVLSPWNEGSGFGAKDRTPKQTLARLLSTADGRLDPFREAAAVAERVGTQYREMGLTKGQAVQAFRNRAPDAALPWIDATVVLSDGEVSFPPLLGSGGNDGRLDFSTNLHQRLLDILNAGPRARRWVDDLLCGVQSEALQVAAVGQFDPLGAGGKRSSPFGDASSLVNPWTFVLMIEGALLFAAGVARRHAHAAGRAAIPFTVLSSAAGLAGGAAGEASRGEVWAPLWQRPYTLPEVRQLFGEARAAWAGRPAVRAVEFYQAVASHGVARGVGAFQRYGLHQRNGLAYIAVPLDRVRVRPLPAVRLAAHLDDWVARIPRTAPATVVARVRRFEAAQIDFAKHGTPGTLLRLLAALTAVELAVAHAGKLRAELPVRRPPRATEFLVVLSDVESPELRIAAGLASCATTRRGLREILLPIEHTAWRSAPIVPGFGLRPLRDVLTDVLVWRLRTGIEEAGNGDIGATTFPSGLRVPAADLHRWAAGGLDDTLIEAHLQAMLALHWERVSHTWTRPAGDAVPVPTLALLHTLAEGIGEPRLALNPGWAVQLRAGHAARVHDQAARRLRRVGRHAAPAAIAVGGPALAAASLPRVDDAARFLTLTTVTVTTSAEESS